MPFSVIGSNGGAGMPGPAGPAGPAGPPGSPGQPRFTGVGAPPEWIPGAEVNDIYLDLASGLLYKYV